MSDDSRAADEHVDAAKLTKKALIEAVAASTGQKKPAVKVLVEAVLAEIGQSLTRGDTLVLPPLGRVSVARKKSAERGEVIVLKLRRTPSAGAAGPSDEAADD